MKLLSVIVATLLLCGCVSVGKQVKQEQLSEFTKGKTSYNEVISKLGQPNTVTSTADGQRHIAYTFIHAQPRAASFIPIIGGLVGGADSTMNMVMITFDKDGLLKDYTSTQSNYGSGTGFAGGTYQPQTPDQPKEAH